MKARTWVLLLAALAALWGCDEGPIKDGRDQGVGYRSGTSEDGYTSSGERGNLIITELHWAGSVREGLRGVVSYDPDDIFIEVQNKHPRPIHITGWQIIVQTGTGHRLEDDAQGFDDHPIRTFVIPARESGEPVDVNEFVVIAKKRDGAFREADYYLEDLVLPDARFSVTIRDIDDRLIEPAGAVEQDIFAGSFDLVTARSMERTQLLFANPGGREASWHSYSLNPWDELHETLQQHVHEDYRRYTFASPGVANSPDYSGNTSSGDFN